MVTSRSPASAIVRAIRLALFVCAGASPVLAQQPLPLWELGAAFGAGWLPHYPASSQHRIEALALPYFAYRGKVLRSDDKGLIRGRLAVSENAEFDVSLAGALSTDSTNNRARAGMPDLDWMGEVGPRLQLTVARAARDAKVDLEIPLRAVISTDFHSVRHVGFISVPEIAYQHENFGGHGGRLKLGFGAAFADQRYQQTLYGVSSRYATAA
ncbi:MAG: MipA/OmpV family protein, partial [Proteobacteria bacterium]|nr:MipA/OmpV family protein [Pseudomonadota bacterium]